ncbi:hypothetical protein DL770_000601 [Monosporascus sp. CRB-9-2]|nr:hypothetical protein DL770_000601 [Monosporascus sp. CRB-9-2]
MALKNGVRLKPPPFHFPGLRLSLQDDEHATGLPTILVDKDERLWLSHRSISDCLHQELGVERLNRIHQHLWWAGRPAAARSLHRQRMRGREIVPTQRADFHLLWAGQRIFVKPLPRYLLDHAFWEKHICPDPALHALACGLLVSYTWLIRHDTDLALAKETHLVDAWLDWPTWRRLVENLAEGVDLNGTAMINPRYAYGELRIKRLNQIYRFAKPGGLRDVVSGYASGYHSYTGFFRENFGWIITFFGFGSIVLSALQVGNGLESLESHEKFRRLSSILALLALLAPFAIAAVSLLLFTCLFGHHLAQTVRYHRKKEQLRRTWNESINDRLNN